MTLLRETHKTLQDNKEELESKIRDKRHDAEMVKKLIMRATPAIAQNHASTLEQYQREESLLAATVKAIETIFADLLTTIENSIEESSELLRKAMVLDF